MFKIDYLKYYLGRDYLHEMDIMPPIYLPTVQAFLLITLIIPIVIAIYFFKKARKSDDKNLNKIGIVFITLGVSFFISYFIAIEEHWFKDSFLFYLFLIIAYILLVISIPIIVKFINSSKRIKRKTTSFNLLTIISLVIIIIFPFLTVSVELPYRPSIYTYDLSIESNSNNEFNLLFPTIVDEEQLNSKIGEEDVEGDWIIEHVVENGTWLKIQGQGSGSIRFEYTGHEDIKWTGISSGENEEDNWEFNELYKIYYFSQSNSTIEIDFEWDINGSGGWTTINLSGELSDNGWQTIPGFQDHMND